MNYVEQRISKWLSNNSEYEEKDENECWKLPHVLFSVKAVKLVEVGRSDIRDRGMQIADSWIKFWIFAIQIFIEDRIKYQ